LSVLFYKRRTFYFSACFNTNIRFFYGNDGNAKSKLYFLKGRQLKVMAEYTTTELEKRAKMQKTNEPTIRSGGSLAPKPNAALIKPIEMQAAPVEVAETPDSDKARAMLVKAELTRLEAKHLPNAKPAFDAPGSSKDMLIAAWLKNWIIEGLASGQLTETHLLPRKADLAKYLNVSIGTVQNAIRYVEDDGFVESKQRIGTVLRNASDEGDSRLRKQTSKRDQAVLAVRKLIVTRSLKPGEPMPSAREVAKLIGSAPNTTRLALEFLSAQGVLLSHGVRGNKANWFVAQVPDISEDNVVHAIESQTLIDQLERDLKTLIASKYEVGAKLASHLELADTFRVSIKTVHDALRRLGQQGIIQSKRGRYGTFVSRLPETQFAEQDIEALFVPVEQHAFYNYQRVETVLRQYIAENFKAGDKLPPMGDLATRFDVSSNTIRKALQNMGEEGLMGFTRGRFGGTFVKALPKVEAKTVTKEPMTNEEARKAYPSKK
jgi:DNA-binding GntR family transcriptional regulator